MKLYFAPGACSLAPHIALREAGLPFEAVAVNLRTRQLADGSDYLAINPKGQVPMLELDNGQRLAEGPVIQQYIADQAPASALMPPAGSWERYRVLEWLNFITSELHKGFSPLFNPAVPAEVKPLFAARVKERLAWVDGELAGREYLSGATFTIADSYLFVVSNWTAATGIDISDLPHLQAFRARVAARPAVQAAMQAEGLLK